MAAAMAAGGCHRPSYDGKLRPDYSRLTVSNRTSWRCHVKVVPAEGAAGSLSTIGATLSTDQDYTWDLPAGTYTLTAERLMPPKKSFSTVYRADPGKHRRWPLLDSSAIAD